MASIAAIELQERGIPPLLHNRNARSAPSDLSRTPERVKAADLEAGSLAICWICFESVVNGENVISPCLCKGSQQFVHRQCLNSWRSIREGFAFSNCTTCRAPYHLRYVELEDKPWWNLKHRILVARDAFIMFLCVQILIGVFGALVSFMDRDGSFQDAFNDSWKQMISRHPVCFYYSTGTIVVFLLAGIIGFAYYLWAIDTEKREEFRIACLGWIILECVLTASKTFIPLALALISAFTIFGVAYGFFLGTLAFHKSWQKHRDVLSKRCLTEEYVVEDLHGYYFAPPKLDPEHEERLRALKLM